MKELKSLNKRTAPKSVMPEKIIQFGEGNFLRAFVDWIVWNMNKKTDFNGSVVVVQPLAGGMVDWLNGQDCDTPNVKNLVAGKQAMSVFKDTRALASAVVNMVDAIMKGEEPEINDTESYDNGTGVIPTYLCDPVVVTVDNYKEMLIDSGYYTEDQIK